MVFTVMPFLTLFLQFFRFSYQKDLDNFAKQDYNYERPLVSDNL